MKHTLQRCLIGGSPLTALLLTALVTYAAAPQPGWVDLLDGKTLNGWTQLNGTATHQVEDGTIVGRTATGSPNSFLCTDRTYGDFELEFEVKVDAGLNSGVQFLSRTKDSSTTNEPGRVYGPQVEIESSGAKGAEAGYVYGEATGRGWLTPPTALNRTSISGTGNGITTGWSPRGRASRPGSTARPSRTSPRKRFTKRTRPGLSDSKCIACPRIGKHSLLPGATSVSGKRARLEVHGA